MRFILLPILLILMNPAGVSAEVAAYQATLDSYLEKAKSEKSPFTEADLAIMKKAGESLAKSLPDPGIKTGEKAPNFILENAFGKTVNLQDKLKQGPVILVFYRGAWCPFCNMHLHALLKSQSEFEKYGAQLIAITPQTPDKSAEQIKEKAYPFEVLSDLDSQVMKDYKLYFEMPAELDAVYKKHGLDVEAFNGKGRTVLPVPGSFVIDRTGVVRAMQAEVDYKMRMEPGAMIEALKAMAEND